MRARALVAIAALFVSGGKAAAFDAASAAYLCAGGALLRVAYLNPENGPGLAVTDWSGVLTPMRAVETASGAFYVDVDARRGLRWRTKGESGVLTHLAPDHAAQERTLLEDCFRW